MTTNHTTEPTKIDPLQLARYYGFEADTADGRHYANGMHAPWDSVKKMAEDRALLKDENTILRARVAQLEAEREAMAKQEPVAYWNKGTSIIPAVDVSYLPNWSDYYPYPLFASPKP